VSCPQQRVGAGAQQHVLVLVAAADAKAWTGPVTVVGKAKVKGKELVREARPAAVTWAPPEANTTRVGRLTREQMLAVRPGAPSYFRLAVDADRVTLSPGGQATVRLKLTRLRADFTGAAQVIARNLPPTVTFGANNQPVTIPVGKDRAEVVLAAKPGTPPGEYTLVFQGLATIPAASTDPAKRPPMVSVLQPSPPLTLVVQPQ
jgi:hypothetical protein